MILQEQQFIIKTLLLVGAAIITLLLARSSVGARHQAIRRVLLVLFALATATMILLPGVSSWAAGIVGVGRGADLLFYSVTVGFACFLAAYYGRMRALNRQITALTRELALVRARTET